MLTLSILLFITFAFAVYSLFCYHKLNMIATKQYALLTVQDKYIDKLLEDIMTLGTIAIQQKTLKEQYAAHLNQEEEFPSLTIKHLN